MSENKEKPIGDKDERAKQVTLQKKVKQIEKDAQVLKLLQQDEDDFQQFEEEAYELKPSAAFVTKQWREDWHDEELNDEFTKQLKREVQSA